MSFHRLMQIVRKLSIRYVCDVSRELYIEGVRGLFRLISKIVISFKGFHGDYIPFVSEYSGGTQVRATERILECRLLLNAVDNLKKYSDNRIIEVGGCSPYFASGMIVDILDCYDPSEYVNIRKDLFDFDFTGYDVISVSTIEHVGTGDYNNEIRDDSVAALRKLLDESRSCLITFPIGYNSVLDNYIMQENTCRSRFYKRGYFDNNFIEVSKQEALRCRYSWIRYADAICVIEKRREDLQ